MELDNIKKGIIKKKKRGIKSFEKATKKYYDSYDIKIQNIINSECNNKDEEITMLWYDACLELPLYDENI